LVEKINMNINGKEAEEALIAKWYSPAKQRLDRRVILEGLNVNTIVNR
jgi:hypothetical protein